LRKLLPGEISAGEIDRKLRNKTAYFDAYPRARKINIEKKP
jgi:hypothetical protein